MSSMDPPGSKRGATSTAGRPRLWPAAEDAGSPAGPSVRRRNGDVGRAQVQWQWLYESLAPARTLEHRSQDAGCVRPRSFDDDRTGARQEHICGALRGIARDKERCLADEAAQRFGKRCRHRRRRLTERTVSIIEKLYVKVLPAAFESHEEETGAPLVSLWCQTGGHSFEAGHTNRARTGSECDSAHSCKSYADAGETAGTDRRSHDV